MYHSVKIASGSGEARRTALRLLDRACVNRVCGEAFFLESMGRDRVMKLPLTPDYPLLTTSSCPAARNTSEAFGQDCS